MLITNFRWKNFEPELNILERSSGKEKILPLMNQHINMTLGKRFCIGYTKNGKHYNCPESSEISSEKQCRLCKSLDDFFPCLQCSGLCINMSNRKSCMEDNFYIYLATFGPLMKVGISREFRIKQRLVEQGADFGAAISRIRDGRIARVYEQRIRRYLGIVDRLKGAEKHPHLFSDPKVCIRNINSAMEKLGKSPFNDILQEPEIFDMREHYNLIDEKSDFLKLENNLVLKGRIACVKGSIALLENGAFKCIDCHGLIGREIIA
jgi:hypothetical protein